MVRTYYTPYSDTYLRCLGGCFGVAIFCCGPGVSPGSRFSGELTRRGELLGDVPFRGPISVVSNRCSCGRFLDVTHKLRTIPRNNRHYFGYCHLQLRRATGLTGGHNFSCFYAALSVDPLGGSRGVGRVNCTITRRCNIT